MFPKGEQLQEYLEKVHGPEVARSGTHHEGHHDDEQDRRTPTRGRVASIQAAYMNYESGETPIHVVPVPGSGRLYDRTLGDAWAEQDSDGEGNFHGFIVDLDPLT